MILKRAKHEKARPVQRFIFPLLFSLGAQQKILEWLNLNELLRLRLVSRSAFQLDFFADSWRELVVDQNVSAFIYSTESLVNFINQRPKTDFLSFDLSRVNLLAKDHQNGKNHLKEIGTAVA